jgi:hypothetical protein
MQIYVQGSKSAINGVLNQGYRVIGTEYTFEGSRCRSLDDSLPNGTVIKFFANRDSRGTPIAKGYGTWNSKKGRVD